MTEQLKEHLEQEGIVHDDVINEEIEKEHKYLEKRKIIGENLKNKNLLPLETTLTIKIVDFIDIRALNAKSISFQDYNKVKEEYINNHKRINKANIQRLINYIEGSGAYVLSLKEHNKNFCPLNSCLDEMISDFEDIFKKNFPFLPSDKRNQ